jgi:hypothetical protein
MTKNILVQKAEARLLKECEERLKHHKEEVERLTKLREELRESCQ